MLLTLGIASLGAARVLVRRPGGYTLLVIGLLLGSFVRPHVSLMALLAFGVALLVGRRESTRPGVTPSSIAKVAGLVVLIVVGGVLASRAATVLDVDDFSSSSINTALDDERRRTEEGGSHLHAAESAEPTGLRGSQRSRSCSDRSRSSRTAPSRSRPRSKACSCFGALRGVVAADRARCSDGCGRSRT